MSVPVNRRSPSKLEAQVKARDLAAYVLRITSNPKVFEPRFQTGLTDRIVSTAVGIHVDSWAANNIRVVDGDTCSERLSLQVRAITACTLLLALIDLARPVFHLESRRIEYWGGLTVDLRELLRSWHSSDVDRYARFRIGLRPEGV